MTQRPRISGGSSRTCSATAQRTRRVAETKAAAAQQALDEKQQKRKSKGKMSRSAADRHTEAAATRWVAKYDPRWRPARMRGTTPRRRSRRQTAHPHALCDTKWPRHGVRWQVAPGTNTTYSQRVAAAVTSFIDLYEYLHSNHDEKASKYPRSTEEEAAALSRVGSRHQLDHELGESLI